MTRLYTVSLPSLFQASPKYFTANNELLGLVTAVYVRNAATSLCKTNTHKKLSDDT